MHSEITVQNLAYRLGSTAARCGSRDPALSYSDQGGRPDGVQVMVNRKFRFINPTTAITFSAAMKSVAVHIGVAAYSAACDTH